MSTFWRCGAVLLGTRSLVNLWIIWSTVKETIILFSTHATGNANWEIVRYQFTLGNWSLHLNPNIPQRSPCSCWACMLSLQFELIESIALRQQATRISHDILLQITSKQIPIHNVYSNYLQTRLFTCRNMVPTFQNSQTFPVSSSLFFSIFRFLNWKLDPF